MSPQPVIVQVRLPSQVDSSSSITLDISGVERVRPERARRGRVEKVWRHVRWAETHPNSEHLSMHGVDVTSVLAMRKLAVLYDVGNTGECAALVRRLTAITVEAILDQLPMDVLHDSLPASLPLLEAIYLKTDSVGDRIDSDCMACDIYVPYCRSILRVIMEREPDFRTKIARKKKDLQRCLRRMRQHGLVSGKGGTLLTLYEALRAELEQQLIRSRAAMHQLDQLLNRRATVDTPVSARGRPCQTSHQRLMKVSSEDVQERIIQSKTLLDAVETAVLNVTLHSLLRTLQARVETDKLLLFHHTELRKMGTSTVRPAHLTGGIQAHTVSSSVNSPESQQEKVAVTLRQFCRGYATILRLAEEVTEAQAEIDGLHIDEKWDQGDSGETSEDGEEDMSGLYRGCHYLSVTRTLDTVKRTTVIRRNGKFVHATSLSASMDLSVEVSPQPECHQDSTEREKDEVLACSNAVDEAVSQVSPGIVPSVAMLEQEVQYLRQELSSARDQIRTLQEHEKQLRERLEDQAHQQFQMGNEQFEDISLGSKRPTELIRRYGELYMDSRVEAMDALDQLPPLKEHDVLKQKIVFSVIVLAFKATQQTVADLRARLRHLLGLPVPPSHSHHHQHPPSSTTDDGEGSPVVNEHRPPTVAESRMEHHITTYLCHTADTFEVADIVFEVCQQIYTTLYDYPCLKACSGLLEYVSQCVRITWGLCVQRLPYAITFDDETFDDGVHSRFHTSDPDQVVISNYLWPALLDSQGVCVSRAVVVT